MQTLPQIGLESFQFLVENIRDYAIIMLDVNGYIVSWNKGAEQIKGYAPEEMIGRHFSLLYTKGEREDSIPQKNLQRAAESGRFEDEGWRVRKDGSVFFASVVITALKDEDGNLTGFGKITHDLTKRKKAEEEIKRLNAELQKQLQKSQTEIFDYKHALDEASVMAVTDQNGMIKHVNDNFCRLSKYSKEELIGQDHRIINSGYHPKEFIRELWLTITSGNIWRGEFRNKAKDGSYYWVDTTIVPFLNEEGKPYQYLAIRNDITQRKLAEEELRKINAELENKVKEKTLELTRALEREKELNETKSKFVSMASHEFRTPLSAILSSISLIEHYNKQEQEVHRAKHIERIKSSVRNLTDILDDFLSLEKLEQGRIEIHTTELDLKEFIEDVIDEVDGMVKKKNQKIIYSYKGLEIVCQDKKLLRNILLNLLSNAVKYSPEEKDIYVSADTGKQSVTVSVADQGIGIPADAQKNLFEKFFRANNAVNIQGTGLGLNIVKRYIELLSGKISFTSAENLGTTFTISFPRSFTDSTYASQYQQPGKP